MAAISLHLEPNSDLNRQPGPCSLYCTRAFRTGQHVCRSRSSGAGCVAFLESPFALRNLHASHALRLHMCSGTFAARWLQHGFQLTSFLLVPEVQISPCWQEVRDCSFKQSFILQFYFPFILPREYLFPEVSPLLSLPSSSFFFFFSFFFPPLQSNCIFPGASCCFLHCRFLSSLHFYLWF